MKYQRGIIVLIHFPFTNFSGAKPRPALVVSSDSFNEGEDIVIAAITTQRQPNEFSVRIEQRDLKEGSLNKESFVKCGQLVTVEKSLIKKAIAVLSKKKLESVREKLHSIV